MKTTATILLVMFSLSGFTQVFGEILSDKRALEKDFDFTIYYTKPGKLVFDIAVDMEGKVTSCVLNKEKSSIKNTPAMIQAKNKIISNLKFERGYHWPKHHMGYVVIKTNQDITNKEEDKFAPPAD